MEDSGSIRRLIVLVLPVLRLPEFLSRLAKLAVLALFPDSISILPEQLPVDSAVLFPRIAEPGSEPAAAVLSVPMQEGSMTPSLYIRGLVEFVSELIRVYIYIYRRFASMEEL